MCVCVCGMMVGTMWGRVGGKAFLESERFKGAAAWCTDGKTDKETSQEVVLRCRLLYAQPLPAL